MFPTTVEKFHRATRTDDYRQCYARLTPDFRLPSGPANKGVQRVTQQRGVVVVIEEGEGTMRPRGPEPAEPASVPRDDGVRLHEDERRPPFGPDAREPDPDQPVGCGQMNTRSAQNLNESARTGFSVRDRFISRCRRKAAARRFRLRHTPCFTTSSDLPVTVARDASNLVSSAHAGRPLSPASVRVLLAPRLRGSCARTRFATVSSFVAPMIQDIP